jgi:hypothetical protein
VSVARAVASRTFAAFLIRFVSRVQFSFLNRSRSSDEGGEGGQKGLGQENVLASGSNR